jgi:hypothetical protein
MLPANSFANALLVVRFLRDGHTLTRSCELAGISRYLFVAACKDNPELRQLFEDAADEGWDVMAETLINIETVTSDARMAKVLSDNIKWFLSKKKAAYGERVTIVNENSADKVITEALRAAILRIPEPVRVPMLDVTPARELSLADVL